jgi:hypothetical protein
VAESACPFSLIREPEWLKVPVHSVPQSLKCLSIQSDKVEILNNAFGFHYLRRGSWTSREEFIAYIAASWPEYNERYTHPFEWTWTNQKMRRWFAEHAR